MSTLTTKLRRDVRTQRAQFVAVVVTVFLGVTLFLSTADAARNLDESYVDLFDDVRFAHLSVTGGDTAGFVAGAESYEGTDAVTSRFTGDVPIATGNHRLIGRVHSLPVGAMPEVNRVRVVEGRYLDGARPDGVLVEKHAADHFDLRPGAQFSMVAPGGARTMTVLGVVTSSEYLWPARSRQDIFPSPDSFAVVFAPPETAGELTGLPAPNEALVYLDSRVDEARAIEELGALATRAGALAIVPRDEQASNATLQTDIAAFGDLAVVFPILFLSAAGLATYVLLTRRVRAERPVIGALLANGVAPRTILRHYLGYGMLAAAVGAVPGVAGGLLLGRLTTELYADAIGIPDARATLHLDTAAIALTVGLAVGALAALAPALWAFRLAPAEAMRPEIPAGLGRRSLFERAFPPLARAPARWRMAVRGVGRNRRRTAFTALGVVFSITLILVSWSVLDTTVRFIDRQYEEIERHDAKLFLDHVPRSGDIAAVAAIPGVADVEPVVHAPISLSAGDRRYDSLVAAFRPGTQMHGFRVVDGPDELSGEGILLGKAAEQELGVGPGDLVDALIPGVGELELPVAGFVDEPLGTFAYLPSDRLPPPEALAPGEAVVSVPLFVKFAPGADTDAVAAAAGALPGVVGYEDAQAVADLVRDYLGLVYVFVGVMLAFGAVMAFALLFASMTVNLSERSVELVTLRANGMPRRSLSRLVTAENLVVALLGVVPGLWAGRRVGDFVMSNYTNDLFDFELHVSPQAMALSVAAVLLVTLVSQWPGLRAIAKLDIATVARERSL